MACALTGAGDALGTGALTSAEGSGSSTEGSGDLRRAELSQAGRDLILTVRTAAPAPLASLDRFPDLERPGSRYLCLELRRAGRGTHRLCLGGEERARRLVGLELVNAAGKTVDTKTIAARVKRPSPRKLALALRPEDAGLAPRRYRWRVLGERRGCEGATNCTDSLPASGARAFRLRPVRAVGCSGGTAGLVSSGPRGRKVVALTFDDGPGSLTPAFLHVLREKRVHATFFVVGQEIGGREETMRRALADGHEIGNHTMHHGAFPGYADMAATSAGIEAATHFRPCLFRPPGGGVNGAVISAAGQAGMRTVTWDVDPGDWANPGSGAVYSRVVGAVRPGSIVVMHDGGGDRGGTLAALPGIVDTLRARGYRFATVTQLLGGRSIFKPYG